MIVRRNKGLANADATDPGFSCQGVVGEFVSVYLRAELLALKLQHYYQTDMQNKQTSLNITALRRAIKHFNLHFSEEKILLIFRGGKGKRGNKSAKQLRNGYLHRLSEADKKEIVCNGKSLIKEMAKLLKLRIKDWHGLDKIEKDI